MFTQLTDLSKAAIFIGITYIITWLYVLLLPPETGLISSCLCRYWGSY
jgi:hypothetical protein